MNNRSKTAKKRFEYFIFVNLKNNKGAKLMFLNELKKYELFFNNLFFIKKPNFILKIKNISNLLFHQFL